MATAYQWMGGEELPQRLKPRVLGSANGTTKVVPSQVQARVLPSRLQIMAGRKNAEVASIRTNREAASSRLERNQKKPAMVEWYTVKKIDNSRLVPNAEPVRLSNYYKTAALGAVIAFFCMFYVYQHFRCIDLSFQLEDLKGKQVQAQALNSALKLEIATLRDPRRIDLIARHQLGLTQPTALQVREYANLDGAEVAAVQYAKREIRK
jgi:cell division protein FtsL